MGQRYCEDCGAILTKGKAFCGKCGAQVKKTPAGSNSATEPPTNAVSRPHEGEAETEPKQYQIAWLSAALYLLVFPALMLPAFTYHIGPEWMGVWRLLDAGRNHSMPTSVWWTSSVTSMGSSFILAAVIALLVAGLANTIIPGARRRTTLAFALLSAVGLLFMVLGGIHTQYDLGIAIGLGAFAPVLPLLVSIGAAVAPNRGFVTGHVGELARSTLYALSASVVFVGLWVSGSYLMSSSYIHTGFDAPVVQRIRVVQMSYGTVTSTEGTLVVPGSVSFVTADGETLEIATDDIEGFDTGWGNHIPYYSSSLMFSDPWDEQELSGPTLVVKEGPVWKSVAPGLRLRVGATRWYVLRGMPAIEGYPAFAYFMEPRPDNEYVFDLEELQ